MATAIAKFDGVFHPALLDDAVAGLTGRPKTLPSKYFYDELGSQLFEDICELPEYYVTRSEVALMREIAGGIAAALPERTNLVEFGSGASVKTRLLLDVAKRIKSYVPIDISSSAVQLAALAIALDYPQVLVRPMVADFTQELELPSAPDDVVNVGYFPGSTIGNFPPDGARAFMRLARQTLGRGSKFIVGADLTRDRGLLQSAYDDAQGVTAAFNKNLLTRLNAECGGEFVLENFTHRAVWNEVHGRMEMHLVSAKEQAVRLGGSTIRFSAGETIHTENSYKYSPEDLEQIGLDAGWHLQRKWLSDSPTIGIFLFEAFSDVDPAD